MRVAIYARYSTDMQKPTSIEDQLRLCRERAEREKWSVAGEYCDPEISGSTLLRPGVQQLMHDAMLGKFDVVLAEALDRLSRDQEDTAALYKRLEFADAAIITLSEGRITQLHVGMSGTMNALFLKNVADKTRRGLRGRVEAGRSGGGLCYGYDVVEDMHDPGKRRINEQEAEIVRRIFTEFAKGRSPRSIAAALNREGIKGPIGRLWGPSTIYGNRRRGVGIINQELYIGRMIWNRLRYVKHPITGKRNSKLNPESEWINVDASELRIVDDELWNAVKDRQKRLDAAPLARKQRPRYLLSGLLVCGSCGGGFSKISQTHYGCSTARNKGTCSNLRTIRRDKLETRVLDALQKRLMNPDAIRTYCQEYTRHMNALIVQGNSAKTGYEAELQRLEREQRRYVQAIADGVPGHRVAADIERVGQRMDELQRLIATAPAQRPLLHPNMGLRYQERVRDLAATLNDAEMKEEAADILRTLVDRIVLAPTSDSKALSVDLHGDLAGILAIADKSMGSEALPRTYGKQDSMVAGARSARHLQKTLQLREELQGLLGAGPGFEPGTFRL